MPLSRTQANALISIHQDASGYPGVSIREPTKNALIKKGYAFRENLSEGRTNGWMLRLTPEGVRMAASILEARKLPPIEEDLMETWESYE